MTFAARVRTRGPSLIRRMSDGAPADAMPLGLGLPSWELPAPAVAALRDQSGALPYGPNAGLPSLRDAVLAHVGSGPAPDAPHAALITNGSQGALFALSAAVLEEGTAVLVPNPGFVAYGMLAEHHGATAVPYPLPAEGGFRLDPDAFLATLEATPEARLAIINHPGNPTGAGATADTLRRVVDACAARDVLLVSDEAYAGLDLARPTPGLRAVTSQGLVLGTVSKAFGAPGLRVGWVCGEASLLTPLLGVHALTSTAAALPSQRAAEALLTAAPTVLEAARQELGLRAAAFEEVVHEHLGRRWPLPDGGFYAWMPVPKAAEDDPLAFALDLRDTQKVVTIPGLAFGEGGRGHLRVSFAAAPDLVREGLRRLLPRLDRDRLLEEAARREDLA